MTRQDAQRRSEEATLLANLVVSAKEVSTPTSVAVGGMEELETGPMVGSVARVYAMDR